MNQPTVESQAINAKPNSGAALSSSALLAALTLAIVELRARRRNAISEGNTKLEEECWWEENRLGPLQHQELIRLSTANDEALPQPDGDGGAQKGKPNGN